MKFGKLENIDEVDFTLPADHPDTSLVLANGGRTGKPVVYIGAAKWGRKDWIGKIYPKGAKEGDMLGYYTRYFNSIELNATHYRFPPVDQIQKWVSTVDTHFRFCPKIHQAITHRYRLKNAERITGDFLDLMTHFGDNLGVMFLQMPANFHPVKLEDLVNYLEFIPADISLALELRDAEWFDSRMDDLFGLMRTRQIGTVITDTAGRRDLLHMRLTTPETFIRFVGNNLHQTDYSRIEEWAKRIRQWIDQGLQKVWFFIHQHDEKYSPELARFAVECFRREWNMDIKWPDK